MKPVRINLASGKNRIQQLWMAAAVAGAIAAISFTAVTVYEYQANKNVILEYQVRIQTLEGQKEERRKAVQKNAEKKEQTEKVIKRHTYLTDIIKKDLFPVTRVLTEIEKVKPDRLDIDEIAFSNDLSSATISGHSDHVKSLIAFFKELERSGRFDIELTKQQINENHRIVFEMNAVWKDGEDDQKI